LFRIVQRRYLFFLLSALMIVPGIVSIIMWGILRSIDFKGGAFLEVAFEDPSVVTEQAIRDVYNALEIEDLAVVEGHVGTGEDEIVTHQMRSAFITADEKEQLSARLREAFGPFEERQYSTAGPSVGAQVTRQAAFAVLFAAVGILLYLTLQFRSVPHPVRYGACAIIAMLHDVLLVLGLASIMGKLYGWDVDALFLTALLTVIGFSVHDSIVVFDRIRENVGRLRGMSFENIVNHSIIQTLDRSINTQLTAIFTLFAIFLYSQGQIQRFVFWLIVGILSGTYSSIFNAAPLLVVWENKEWRNWFGRSAVQPA
jgi:preprotein translocase subunit SecF